MPPHGLTDIPAAMRSYAEFDLTLNRMLCILTADAARMSAKLQWSALYGPWEGGMSPADMPQMTDQPVSMDVSVLAWNVRGALGSASSQESHDGKIRQLTKTLHETGVGVAVLSEPKLAEGMLWPEWTGYEYHGQRSQLPDTVGWAP